MEKIYVLRKEAQRVLALRGHAVGRYDREFQIRDGKIIKKLRSKCSRCGAPILVIDWPNKSVGEVNISGPAYDYFCKKGPVEQELVYFGNVFYEDVKKAYDDRNMERLRELEKKLSIDDF